MSGDGNKADVKGNRLPGDGGCSAWENLLDLSHSVYPGSCHSHWSFPVFLGKP